MFLVLLIGVFLVSSASVFGQHQRLEPLHPDKKIMWKREMNCLLSVCDYIVEFVSTSQMLQDGTTIEVKKEKKLAERITLISVFVYLRVLINTMSILSGVDKQTAVRYSHQPSCIEKTRYHATRKTKSLLSPQTKI